MKIFYFTSSGLKRSALFAIFMILVLPLIAQNPAANLDQIRNGPYTAPISPVNWVNGDVNASQAHMVEDYSIPYRVVMTNMPTNGTVVNLIIEYDTRHSSKNAFDFITAYNNLEDHSVWGHSAETINPLRDYSALSVFPEVQITITKPGITNGATSLGDYWDDFNTRKPGIMYMSLWGGDITGIVKPFDYTSEDSLNSAITSTQITVSFHSNNATVILSWGAHIAREQDWGFGNSAGGISGAPYHTSLIDWNLSNLGNQDRSLQAAAVIPDFNCDFTVPSPVCLNTTDTAKKTTPYSSLAVYTWSITDIVGADPSPLSGKGTEFVFNSGSSAGSFTVNLQAAVPFLNDSIYKNCSIPVTVNGGPTCSVTPDDPPQYCPESTHSFSGPAGMSSYLWTITGNGTISGSNSDQSVSVVAGTECDSTFTLNLTITDENNCTSQCHAPFLVNDTTKPVISTAAFSMYLECNPVSIDPPLFEGNDNCEGTFTPDVTDYGPVQDGCDWSETWTAKYTDACGNVADSVSITFTWTVDTIAPVISTDAYSHDLGCNPGTITDPTFTGSDNCLESFIPDVSTAGPVQDGCSWSQTWTADYTDACGNPAEQAVVKYTWTVDTIPPVISTAAFSYYLGCNPETVDAPVFDGNDNCEGTFTPDVTDYGPVQDGCDWSETWTAKYTDACLNVADSVSITFTWTVDTIAPLISTDAYSHDLGCNPESIPEPTFTGSDNCLESFTPDVYSDGPTQDGCTWSQSWSADYTDACGNPAIQKVITYTWKVDTDPPVLTGCPSEAISLGCDPTDLPTCDDALALITAEDVCDGTIQPTCSAGDVQTSGNELSQTFMIYAEDECGNIDSCAVTYTWTLCEQMFCTYTQGYWGQINGVACNGLTSQANLAILLATKIELGYKPNNRSYTIAAGSVQCVLDVLPASGKPAMFAANYQCTTLLKNTLFGQTLALQLNMRYDQQNLGYSLGDKVLPANGILSVAPSATCNPAGFGITYRTIPASVMAYLTANYTTTVGGVYNLCNDALGNHWPTSLHPSYDDVNYAVTAINEAYDKCGTFVNPPLPVKAENNYATAGTALEIDVTIVPNPFVSSTEITFTTNQDVDEMYVEVYNLMGQKIASLYHGPVSGDTQNSLTFNAGSSDPQGIYQVVLRSESGQTVKRMIRVK